MTCHKEFSKAVIGAQMLPFFLFKLSVGFEHICF